MRFEIRWFVAAIATFAHRMEVRLAFDYHSPCVPAICRL